jgi:hypothetical protein
MLCPLEANHRHSEDLKVDHLLQTFEVSSDRKEDVACPFVRAPRRGVSWLSSLLDHCYLHPSVPEPVERERAQGGSDAAALVVGVDGRHGDLTHAALGIIRSRPPRSRRRYHPPRRPTPAPYSWRRRPLPPAADFRQPPQVEVRRTRLLGTP